MRCYRHRDEEAIGVCCHCGKGACARCAVDPDQGITCSEPCRAQLGQTRQLRARLMQVHGIGAEPPGLPAAVIMYGLFCLILAIVATFATISRHRFDYLTFAMSAVFLVMAILSYRRFRQSCGDC